MRTAPLNVRLPRIVLGDDGTRAVYRFEIEGVSKNEITFRRVKDRWYLEN